jgi:hypothetical protein
MPVRPRRVAALAAIASLLIAAPALAAPAPPAPTPQGPPKLSSLRLPGTITGESGHAALIVGVRVSTPSEVTVQIESRRTRSLVRSASTEGIHRAGRAYLLIDAVSTQGFQLAQGRYTAIVRARDGRNRLSNELRKTFTLKLTTARGRLDVYAVPAITAFNRTARKGQLVVAVGPGSPAARAGIRRGDLITALAGSPVPTPGAFSAVRRGLRAERPIRVTLVRGGSVRTVQFEPPPDWTKAVDYERILRVARRRAPNDFAVHYASAIQLIDAGKRTTADALMADWRRSWRLSAPGQHASGRSLLAADRPKQALGAFNRALSRDPVFHDAQFDRGRALAELGNTTVAEKAFAGAERQDPASALAPAFRAYVLVGDEKLDEALAAANRAVTRDPNYADAYIPRGIALLGKGERVTGLQALRRGLLLLGEGDRADEVIRENLEPADP